MRQQFDITRLNDLDDRIVIGWNRLMESVIADLSDRPGAKDARTVTLEMKAKPVLLQDGDVVGANVSWKLKSSVPPFETGETQMAITTKGQLIFNDLSQDNPHQLTLDELAE